MAKLYDPVDRSKSRKPRNTPWAKYNSDWIKAGPRRRAVPTTKKGG